jgi:subtilisin-like proprotein convertase family protein
MLVVRRKEGQWLEVQDTENNHSFRFRVYNIQKGVNGRPGTVDIALDDEPKHFYFNRPERIIRGGTEGL